MPEMPSADMRTMSTMNPIRGPEFNISSKDVEGLVLEIKENLRLSATTMKAIPCSHLSRKSSRASPYRIPGKFCCDSATCDSSCLRKAKRKLQQDPAQEDPAQGREPGERGRQEGAARADPEAEILLRIRRGFQSRVAAVLPRELNSFFCVSLIYFVP
ncbi:unnamed protein product [Tenebrio molitor]|nr:unnamed protein product [Tenebrio molitor]